MGSRRQAEGDGVRLPKLSRRAVITGTSAAVLSGTKAAAALPAPASEGAASGGARACERWLHLNARIERLQTRWANLEGWLAREHGWFQLSPAEQQALPWARELQDIDGCLDLLFEQREALLETLPTHGSATFDEVLAKLAVVERLIGPDDHREAHALIAGARQDLIALMDRSWSSPRGGGLHRANVRLETMARQTAKRS